ncbi:MAG: acyl-CoA dehydrogenase family protein [Pseudomonadota bacterium]
MDWDLNEDQRILQQTARNFLKKECPRELVREVNDGDQAYSPDLWKKMAGLGWMGLSLPEDRGGSGLSFLDLIVLLEEMGYFLCPGPFISSTVLGGALVLSGGDEAQKRDWLPRLARGELILTLAVEEPGGGWETSALKTTAARDGAGWVLDGVKLFIPDAGAADYILCAARTGEGDGLTVFAVDAKAPGVRATPLKTITKEKLYEVVFDRVRLRDQDVVGPEGRARPLVQAALDQAALARAADALGAMRAALDLTAAYAKERVQFGRPIGSYQAIQHYLVDMWMDILGLRNLVLKAAWKLASGGPADQEIAMAKARAGESGRKATTVGHRIFGAIGFTMEHDLHLYHRRTLGADMAFGNSDYQYEKVAVGLGL